MVRTSQLLHAQRELVAPKPAATVLLLRDTAQGIEVLMTRRSAAASFAPGAYVFPGGGIDAADAQADAKRSAADPGHRGDTREFRGIGRPAGAPCRRPPRRCARHRGDRAASA